MKLLSSRVAAVIISGLLVAPTFAQLSDGSFESQTAGTTFSGAWIEGGGGSSTVDTAALNGFPSNGLNYARLDAVGGTQYTSGCQVAPPALMGGWIYQDFGAGSPVATVSIDWTWLNNEGANQATYNDFFQVSLYDVTTPATPVWLADVVYVDTHTTLAPACPNAGVTLPLAFAGSEPAPAGVKTAVISMSSVPGYVSGMALRLICIVGNRGDTAVSSPAFVDNVVVVGTCPVNGQANSLAASLLVNGLGTNPCNAPFAQTLSQPGTLTMTWSGPANAPFALFASTPAPLSLNAGCIGFVDIGLGGLNLVFDGVQPGLLNSLCHLNAAGTATLSFSTSNMPAGLFAAIQGLVYQTSGPCSPVVLTAAHYLLF